jgi:hypothetical protein
MVHHIVARACIGRCFAYGNYEPASGQFRVRARPDNGIALSAWEDTVAVEAGTYVVRPRDMPLHQIYQCRQGWAELCIAKLEVGERNDHSPAHPVQ